MRRRLVFAGLLMFPLLIPVLCAWLLMLPLLSLDQINATLTPNPLVTRTAFRGPATALVEANSLYAGALAWWVIPGGICLVGYSVAAAWWADFSTDKRVRQDRHPSTLSLVALLFGLTFAAPWIHGLVRLMT